MIFDGSVHPRGKNTSVKSQDLSRQWESIQIWVSIVFSCVRYWIFFNGDWPRLFLLRSFFELTTYLYQKGNESSSWGFQGWIFSGCSPCRDLVCMDSNQPYLCFAQEKASQLKHPRKPCFPQARAWVRCLPWEANMESQKWSFGRWFFFSAEGFRGSSSTMSFFMSVGCTGMSMEVSN